MAVSLSDILASLQNGTVAVNGLSKQVAATFPQRGHSQTQSLREPSPSILLPPLDSLA
jgi:hypothetical protein